MKVINTEQVNACLTAYEVEIEKSEFDKALSAAYREISKEIRLDGFRKGKAPRALLEKIYNVDQDPVPGMAAEHFVKDNFDALKALFDKEPYAQVSYDVESSDIASSGIITIKFNVPGEPVVSLGEYKGIEADRFVKTVSDEDVQSEIDNMVARQTKVEPVLDRPVGDDDTVFVEFLNKEDETKNSTESFVIDGKIPANDEILKGMEIGDTKDGVSLYFDEGYYNKELAGTTGTFDIRIKTVYHTNKPEVTDEWVAESFKDAPDDHKVETVEQLRKTMRENMQKQLDNEFENMFQTALIDKVVENASIEFPEAMLEPRIENRFRGFADYLKQQNMKVEDYMKMYQLTPEMMYEEFKKTEEVNLRRSLAAGKIIEEEKLDPTEEEIDAAVAKKAEERKSTFEAFKEMCDKNEYMMNLIKDEIVNKKFMDFLKENAKINEKDWDKYQADKAAEEAALAAAQREAEKKAEEKTEEKAEESGENEA
ncbi:MAG: trigger factor [Abditibacteriota bacterium]|nr:trigger factor [Abditibacteriota bacterium]